MGRILIAWELGEGLGHVVKLKPLVQELSGRGWEVFVAAKDVAGAAKAFDGDRISLLPAPFKQRRTGVEFSVVNTYARLLHNAGFGEGGVLLPLIESWRNLIRLTRPEVVLAEHSPSALAAAHSLGVPRIVAGTGFVCPPDQQPIPALRSGEDVCDRTRTVEEKLLLERLNDVLEKFSATPFDYLAQLYSQADDLFLLTYPELDHFPHRVGATYWGTSTILAGKRPQWLSGGARRVFAYLKPFPELERHLKALAASGHDVLAYVPGLAAETRRKLAGPNLRFAQAPVDLREVGDACDAAVLNGTHGTTAAFLLAGKPTLHLPIYLEQELVVGRVRRLGAGDGLPRNRPQELVPKLNELLEGGIAAKAAQGFAARYVAHDPRIAAVSLADRVESVVNRSFGTIGAVG